MIMKVNKDISVLHQVDSAIISIKIFHERFTSLALSDKGEEGILMRKILGNRKASLLTKKKAVQKPKISVRRA